jgi:GDPmannose 4,6-dehydratase
VVGVSRDSVVFKATSSRISHEEQLGAAIADMQPDECYHLAAHHGSSSTTRNDDVDACFRANLHATAHLLEVLRRHAPKCRVLLAGSCQMFGSFESRVMPGRPLHEGSVMLPETPYGITKLAATQLGRAYWRAKALEVCTAILFNHESPRRPSSYVTQMLAEAAARAERDPGTKIEVRDIGARVDWGYAGDYAAAMVKMLGADELQDYVVATGELHTVAEFARVAFERVGRNWREHVAQSGAGGQKTVYCGDPGRIVAELGWGREVGFVELVHMMVDAARKRLG